MATSPKRAARLLRARPPGYVPAVSGSGSISENPLYPTCFPPQGGAPMPSFVVEGGFTLQGSVRPAGNKNAALPALAATLITGEEGFL